MEDTNNPFDVSTKALDLIHKDFQDKQILLAYENITHDGGDELESDIYHVYIFTLEDGTLHYYTSSYEKRYVPSDRLEYPSVNGTTIDATLPKCYLKGVFNRLTAYFQYAPENPHVKSVISILSDAIEAAAD